MNHLRLTALSTLAGLSLVAACGSSSKPESQTDDGVQGDTVQLHLSPFEKKLKIARLVPSTQNAMASAPLDVSPDSVYRAGYPAFAPNVPQIQSNGGPTLKNPRIVTVTWDGDANRDVYEAFGDGIGATSFWKAATSEYGVGRAESGPDSHVHISTPLTAITPEEIDALVRANVVGAPGTGWPTSTPDTLYAVYLPPNTLRFGGTDACQSGVGGYHTDSPVDPSPDAGPGGPEFNYAVNINCPNKWDVHGVTMIASHEFAEAATDPFPSVTPGYVGFDEDHLAYEFYQQFQDEVGDACEFFRSSEYVGGAPFAFGLQREWSNKSAKAGHNPCVPRTKLPYFDVTTFAEKMDKIQLDLTSLGDVVHTTAGFKVTLGQATTFDIGFYSDAPTGDWTVWTKVPASLPIRDNNNKPIPNGVAASTIDNPAGHNGHTAKVTVTPSALSSLGVLYLELHSVLEGAEERVYPVFLAAH